VNGPVLAVVSDGAGGWFIGGEFTYVGGVARTGLAHINSDGTVDTTWNPGPTCDSSCPGLPAGPPAGLSAKVTALATSGDELFVGGVFSSIGGQEVSDLAEVSTSGSGTADASWAPDPSSSPDDASSVTSLVVSGSDLFVGGHFSAIGGQSVSNLAEISTDGSGAANATWDPNPNAIVNSIVLSGSDLFVGGNFTAIGGESRSSIAELTTSGSGAADPTWNPDPDRPLMVPAGVYAMALSGTSLFVGGEFTSIGGQSRRGLAELSTAGTGTADPTWDPAGAGAPGVDTLVVAGDELYVGGSFNQLGGVDQANLVRVSTTGSGAADASWDPNVNGIVNALAVAGSSIYAGGQFTSAGALNVHRSTLVRLAPDGGLDQAWTPVVSGNVEQVAVSHGELYVAGEFEQAGGLARDGIARISIATGQVDPNWDPDLGADATATRLAVSRSDIYVIGIDDVTDGAFLDKLPTAGSGQPDPGWNPDPNGEVQALSLSGSDLYVSGAFTTVGGQQRAGLAKLSTTGSGNADPTWDPDLGFVNDGATGPLAVSGGNVYVSGEFPSPPALYQCKSVKLSADATGQVDPSWNPAANGCVDRMVVAGDDLIVGGSFSSLGAQPALNLGAVSPTGAGTADPSWNPAVNNFGAPNDIGDVYGLATSGNGLVIAGYFGSVGQYSTGNVAVFGDISRPSVTVSTPADGATYRQGEHVAASYACSDPGGVVALASCDGPVASGQAIALSTRGPHTFTVTATDADGNTRSKTVTYTVAANPAPAPSNKFTTLRPFRTEHTRGHEHILIRVKVPGRGSLSVKECAVRSGVESCRAMRSPMVFGGRMSVAHAGTFTLSITLTRTGLRAASRHGRITAALEITYAPTGGRSASKTVKVTFVAEHRKRTTRR
jgi:hypothetical protein